MYELYALIAAKIFCVYSGHRPKSLSLQLRLLHSSSAHLLCIHSELPGMASVPITKIKRKYTVHRDTSIHFKQSMLINE